jgi:hypothetical protein
MAGQVFGDDYERFREVARGLVQETEKKPRVYRFHDMQALDRLSDVDLARAYWSEMLDRAHLAGTTSLLRSYQWSEGAETAYQCGQFLSFYASLRGLIESTADSFQVLSRAAMTLADAKAGIEANLAGSVSEVHVAGELEESLIHFTHGRKVKKGEGAPPSHAALPAAHYLRALEDSGLTGSVELYGQLCEYTHPSALSVLQFAISHDGSHVIVDPTAPAADAAQLLRTRKELLELLLHMSFNPGIVLLRVLAHIADGRYATTCVEALDLKDLPIWDKVADTLGIRAPA